MKVLFVILWILAGFAGLFGLLFMAAIIKIKISAKAYVNLLKNKMFILVSFFRFKFALMGEFKLEKQNATNRKLMPKIHLLTHKGRSFKMSLLALNSFQKKLPTQILNVIKVNGIAELACGVSDDACQTALLCGGALSAYEAATAFLRNYNIKINFSVHPAYKEDIVTIMTDIITTFSIMSIILAIFRAKKQANEEAKNEKRVSARTAA